MILYKIGMRIVAFVAALALIGARPAHAVELQFYFSALQRILAEQMFTQDGRLYVRGDQKNNCDFAFLEKPVVAADNARLIIKARFSGQAGQTFFGHCFGFGGDSFDVVISAVPQYRDGSLALRDVRVDAPGRDSFYVRRVRAGMADSLSKRFKYPIATEAKRVLEESKPPVRRELRRFDVREIRVLPDSVVVVLDFQLAIR